MRYISNSMCNIDASMRELNLSMEVTLLLKLCGSVLYIKAIVYIWAKKFQDFNSAFWD